MYVLACQYRIYWETLINESGEKSGRGRKYRGIFARQREKKKIGISYRVFFARQREKFFRGIFFGFFARQREKKFLGHFLLPENHRFSWFPYVSLRTYMYTLNIWGIFPIYLVPLSKFVLHEKLFCTREKVLQMLF